MNDLIRDFFPSYIPNVLPTESLLKWADEAERLFKQPIKQIFPYPIEVKKVYSSTTGKLIKMIFEVALAGISEKNIKVQLKKNKFITIKVDPDAEDTEATDNASKDEDVDIVYSSRSIARRDGEITFKLFNDVDIEKFKSGVKFKNGLLTIELYPQDQTIKDEDVIDADIIM